MTDELSQQTEGKQPEIPPKKISLWHKITYGSGALSDNLIMNVFGSLVIPIYNIGLKLDPFLVGLAVAIPRLLDAISDPIMGNLSDNTRTRWGRRRPYILTGAILCAILLPFIWMPPFSSQMGMFTYLTVIGVVYFTCYTVFTIPYAALGFELTGDYDERTRLLAWPNYVGLLGSLAMPWLYKLTLGEGFENEVVGAQMLSIGVGIVIIFCGVLPAVILKEPRRGVEQPKIKLLDAAKFAIRNRPFLIVVVSNVIVLLGLATVASLGLYLNIYLVYDGDKTAAATLSGISGTLVGVMSYFSVIMATKISSRWSKQAAVQVGLGLSLIGALSFWFTLTPDYPYLQLLSAAIYGLGLQGCWMLFISMIGDVCEEDELHSGSRREGIYSAVGGFSRKLAVAAAALGTGLILKICGFDAESAESTGADSEVIQNLKIAFVLGQALVLVAAILLIRKYPINRQRAEETQKILRARRQPGNLS